MTSLAPSQQQQPSAESTTGCAPTMAARKKAPEMRAVNRMVGKTKSLVGSVIPFLVGSSPVDQSCVLFAAKFALLKKFS